MNAAGHPTRAPVAWSWRSSSPWRHAPSTTRSRPSGRTAPGNTTRGVLLFSRPLIAVRKNYLTRRADACLTSQRGRSRLVVPGIPGQRAGRHLPTDHMTANAGRAAIFRDVVSGRYFLLRPRRRGATRYGGSRRLTPVYGAWLFQSPLLGSSSSSRRETVRNFSVSLLGSIPA